MFDLQHPFFEPLWIRIVIVLVTLAWAVFEFFAGSPGWAILFGAVGGYAAWQFFVVWKPGKGDE